MLTVVVVVAVEVGCVFARAKPVVLAWVVVVRWFVLEEPGMTVMLTRVMIVVVVALGVVAAVVVVRWFVREEPCLSVMLTHVMIVAGGALGVVAVVVVVVMLVFVVVECVFV
jgi:hypothetical protein